jgi:hypothetical protein
MIKGNKFFKIISAIIIEVFIFNQYAWALFITQDNYKISPALNGITNLEPPANKTPILYTTGGGWDRVYKETIATPEGSVTYEIREKIADGKLVEFHTTVTNIFNQTRKTVQVDSTAKISWENNRKNLVYYSYNTKLNGRDLSGLKIKVNKPITLTTENIFERQFKTYKIMLAKELAQESLNAYYQISKVIQEMYGQGQFLETADLDVELNEQGKSVTYKVEISKDKLNFIPQGYREEEARLEELAIPDGTGIRIERVVLGGPDGVDPVEYDIRAKDIVLTVKIEYGAPHPETQEPRIQKMTVRDKSSEALRFQMDSRYNDSEREQRTEVKVYDDRGELVTKHIYHEYFDFERGFLVKETTNNERTEKLVYEQVYVWPFGLINREKEIIVYQQGQRFERTVFEGDRVKTYVYTPEGREKLFLEQRLSESMVNGQAIRIIEENRFLEDGSVIFKVTSRNPKTGIPTQVQSPAGLRRRQVDNMVVVKDEPELNKVIEEQGFKREKDPKTGEWVLKPIDRDWLARICGIFPTGKTEIKLYSVPNLWVSDGINVLRVPLGRQAKEVPSSAFLSLRYFLVGSPIGEKLRARLWPQLKKDEERLKEARGINLNNPSTRNSVLENLRLTLEGEDVIVGDWVKQALSRRTIGVADPEKPGQAIVIPQATELLSALHYAYIQYPEYLEKEPKEFNQQRFTKWLVMYPEVTSLYGLQPGSQLLMVSHKPNICNLIGEVIFWADVAITTGLLLAAAAGIAIPTPPTIAGGVAASGLMASRLFRLSQGFRNYFRLGSGTLGSQMYWSSVVMGTLGFATAPFMGAKNLEEMFKSAQLGVLLGAVMGGLFWIAPLRPAGIVRTIEGTFQKFGKNIALPERLKLWALEAAASRAYIGPTFSALTGGRKSLLRWAVTTSDKRATALIFADQVLSFWGLYLAFTQEPIALGKRTAGLIAQARGIDINAPEYAWINEFVNVASFMLSAALIPGGVTIRSSTPVPVRDANGQPVMVGGRPVLEGYYIHTQYSRDGKTTISYFIRSPGRSGPLRVEGKEAKPYTEVAKVKIEEAYERLNTLAGTRLERPLNRNSSADQIEAAAEIVKQRYGLNSPQTKEAFKARDLLNSFSSQRAQLEQYHELLNRTYITEEEFIKSIYVEGPYGVPISRN